MSDSSKKGKQIDSWEFKTTQYPNSGKLNVEANIRYTDGSSERESQGTFPKESREKSAGKESVADILTNLDNKMKERQRQQQLEQK